MRLNEFLFARNPWLRRANAATMATVNAMPQSPTSPPEGTFRTAARSEQDRAGLAAMGTGAGALRAMTGNLQSEVGSNPLAGLRLPVGGASPNAMPAYSSAIQSFQPTGGTMYGGGTFGRRPPTMAQTPMQAYGATLPPRTVPTPRPVAPTPRLMTDLQRQIQNYRGLPRLR
jgi:hypothetical protein